jgi:chorismate-pyruvate lyase
VIEKVISGGQTGADQAGRWLRKLAIHGDGIALVFARTETTMFFRLSGKWC